MRKLWRELRWWLIQLLAGRDVAVMVNVRLRMPASGGIEFNASPPTLVSGCTFTMVPTEPLSFKERIRAEWPAKVARARQIEAEIGDPIEAMATAPGDVGLLSEREWRECYQGDPDAHQREADDAKG